jgi:hypothetical protein
MLICQLDITIRVQRFYYQMHQHKNRDLTARNSENNMTSVMPKDLKSQALLQTALTVCNFLH